jgi:hypothetical protein
MSRQRVIANDLIYTISSADADAVAEAEQLWAIVIGHVIDELTGEAPHAPIRVTTTTPGLATRVDADGAMCVIARPWLRFPPLDAPANTVGLTITAQGYLPFNLNVSVPGHQRSLTANANADTRILSLSSDAGLHAGQILLVGPHGANAERCIIANLGPLPGQVTLRADLVYNHAASAPIVADAFGPVDLHDVPLRRRPVVIRGRTIVRTNTGTMHVPNATVQVSGIWRQLDDVRRHLPAVPASMVSVTPGLYSQRAMATALDEIPLTPVAGEDKLTGAPVRAGETRLLLSDRVNVVGGISVLAIDQDDVDRVEHLLVSGLASTLLTTDPTEATVNFSLRNEHARGTRVARVALGAPASATKHLTEQAIPGDQTLFLDSTAFAGDSGMAGVGGGASVEFQQFARFRVTSDTQGYFVLPPLHRVAQIEIEASAAGFTPINTANNNTLLFQTDYTVPENWLDVVFES